MLGLGGRPPGQSPPSSLTKVSSYAPGAAPSAPGVFVRFAHPAGQAARLLAQAAESMAARPAARPGALRRRLVLSLLALAAAGIAIDVMTGFGRWTFTLVLVPLALAGIPIALALTVPPGRGVVRTALRNLASRFVGLIAVALVLGFVGALVGIAMADSLSLTLDEWWRGLAAAFLFVVLLFAFAGTGASAAGATHEQQDRLDAARQTLEGLRDDVAAGKPVTGWVDLTGAEQPQKLSARGTASSGAQVEIYRDEWFHLAAPLRDGTRLRVAAVERCKVKLPRWVTRSGKMKRKPRSAESLHTFEVRVRVDPAVYRTKPPTTVGGRIGRLAVSALQVTADSVSGVFVPAQHSRPNDILEAVAHVFGHLERVPAAEQP